MDYIICIPISVTIARGFLVCSSKFLLVFTFWLYLDIISLSVVCDWGNTATKRLVFRIVSLLSIEYKIEFGCTLGGGIGEIFIP